MLPIATILASFLALAVSILSMGALPVLLVVLPAVATTGPFLGGKLEGLPIAWLSPPKDGGIRRGRAAGVGIGVGGLRSCLKLKFRTGGVLGRRS